MRNRTMLKNLKIKWVQTYRLDPIKNPEVPQKHSRSQYAKGLHYSYFKGWDKVGDY